MKTFQELPTSEEFRKLSDLQIDLILYSLEEDFREAERARKGLTAEADYFDSTFDEEVWSKKPGEWEVLKEGHDPNKIAQQVEELTREEDLKNLYSKFDSLDEYNAYLEAGGKTTRETEVEQYIDRQIQAAQEKAQAIEATKAKKGGGKQLVDDRDLPQVSEQSKNGIEDLDREAIERSIKLFNSTDEVEVEDEEDDGFTPL